MLLRRSYNYFTLKISIKKPAAISTASRRLGRMIRSTIERGMVEATESGNYDDRGGDYAEKAKEGSEIAGEVVGGRHPSLFD
jgi:hypothetical protein